MSVLWKAIWFSNLKIIECIDVTCWHPNLNPAHLTTQRILRPCSAFSKQEIFVNNSPAFYCYLVLLLLSCVGSLCSIIIWEVYYNVESNYIVDWEFKVFNCLAHCTCNIYKIYIFINVTFAYRLCLVTTQRLLIYWVNWVKSQFLESAKPEVDFRC